MTKSVRAVLLCFSALLVAGCETGGFWIYTRHEKKIPRMFNKDSEEESSSDALLAAYRSIKIQETLWYDLEGNLGLPMSGPGTRLLNGPEAVRLILTDSALQGVLQDHARIDEVFAEFNPWKVLEIQYKDLKITAPLIYLNTRREHIEGDDIRLRIVGKDGTVAAVSGDILLGRDEIFLEHAWFLGVFNLFGFITEQINKGENAIEFTQTPL